MAAWYGLAVLTLLALRWIDPPTTSVQMERRVQAVFEREPYRKRYTFVPLERISPAFQHAVVAAEDARFYEHHGFDWRQVQIAAVDMEHDKRTRGASTIDQQLVKNLLLTDSRTLLRKAFEATLVPPAEVVLGKRRILELYLNVAEWGPGVYGAEAAARYYYHVPAIAIGREQGARLAALLPAPRHRTPATVGLYSTVIVERMRQMGW